MGFYIGGRLGDPWTLVFGGIGFILGLLGDRYLLPMLSKDHTSHGMPCCGGGLTGHKHAEVGADEVELEPSESHVLADHTREITDE